MKDQRYSLLTEMEELTRKRVALIESKAALNKQMNDELHKLDQQLTKVLHQLDNAERPLPLFDNASTSE